MIILIPKGDALPPHPPSTRVLVVSRFGACECVVLPLGLTPHQQALDDGVAVLALVVHHLDVVQVGVGPVHQSVDQVQRDAVGEHDLAVHQLGAVLPVHVAALNPGCGAIVGEEDFPGEEEMKPQLFVSTGPFSEVT